MNNARPGHAEQAQTRTVWLIGAIAIIAIVGGAIALGMGGVGPSPSTAPPKAFVSAATTAVSQTTAPGTPTPTSSTAPTGTPSPEALAAIAIVPVADFRSTADSIIAADVSKVLAGSGGRWKSLELVASQTDAVLASIGVARSTVGARLIEAPDAKTLMADLATHRDRLAFMRADEVGPGVRALGWNGLSLFGTHRLKVLAAW